MIKDFEYSKVSLMVDGINSQLSDIDYYDQVRKAIKTTDTLSYDVTLPYYFRKNPYLNAASEGFGKSIVDQYLRFLE